MLKPPARKMKGAEIQTCVHVRLSSGLELALDLSLARAVLVQVALPVHP